MNNLKEILNKYDIRVPIIQRDYAQGREEEKVLEIRDTFLNSISDRLTDNNKLHLDFVYGSINDNIFIPLDGQQRLTTLFLLYWYFGKKEKKDINFLNKFTYETRASSREFCQKLIRNKMDFDSGSLVKNIENSTWFLAFWKNDPTIKSMLVMIGSIHKKFTGVNFFDRLENITFKFFELEKFGLNDDLYIKMNARGKPLTEFETFKARFEQFLGDKNESLKLEFSKNIDNKWTDFFWQYKDNKYLIDKAFMNYFNYITEMLYNKNKKDSKLFSKLDFKTIEIVYNDTDNIKFLFKSLNKLQDIADGFDMLFSKNEYQKGKIALFDKDINFLELVIKSGNISIQKKFILFMMIAYLIDNDVNDNFKDFIRVVRNFIERIRNTQSRSLQYTANFEYKELNRILNLFLKYLNKDIYAELIIDNDDWGIKDFKHEIDKAKLISQNSLFKDILFKLEDYQYLKGDIHNFLDDDINKLKLYADNIKEIFDNKDDSLIIRAMITTGDSRYDKGRTAKVDNRYFFGKYESWEIFLTDSNSNKKSFFKHFIKKYNDNQNNFTTMIDNFLATYTSIDKEKDWKYYFVKYKTILEKDSKLFKDSNFFAWYGNGFNIEKMGGIHLGAYHINPYIKVVAIETNEEYEEYTKSEEHSYLQIPNYISRIDSFDKNWTIEFSNKISEKIKDTLIDDFSLEFDDTNYILKVGTNDRIEIAVDFIKSVNSWESDG